MDDFIIDKRSPTFLKEIQLFNEISFCENNIIFPLFNTYKLGKLQTKCCTSSLLFYEIVMVKIQKVLHKVGGFLN